MGIIARPRNKSDREPVKVSRDGNHGMNKMTLKTNERAKDQEQLQKYISTIYRPQHQTLASPGVNKYLDYRTMSNGSTSGTGKKSFVDRAMHDLDFYLLVQT